MTKSFIRPQAKPAGQVINARQRNADVEHVMGDKRPYMMYESAQVCREMDIYISDEFAEPMQYCEMIHVIRTAGPNDVIRIHLNTPGGRLDTGIQLISAIRSCEGHVVTVLDGVAHSMGALLFLCGSEMVVHDHCQLMFHTYSGGVMGKGSDIRGQTEATEEWFSEIAYDICHPFMSRGEIKRMLKGEDFWFQTADIQRRLEKMFDALAKQQSEAAADAEAEDESLLIEAVERLGYDIVKRQPETESEVLHCEEAKEWLDASEPEVQPIVVPEAEVPEAEVPEVQVEPKPRGRNAVKSQL